MGEVGREKAEKSPEQLFSLLAKWGALAVLKWELLLHDYLGGLLTILLPLLL